MWWEKQRQLQQHRHHHHQHQHRHRHHHHHQKVIPSLFLFFLAVCEAIFLWLRPLDYTNIEDYIFIINIPCVSIFAYKFIQFLLSCTVCFSNTLVTIHPQQHEIHNPNSIKRRPSSSRRRCSSASNPHGEERKKFSFSYQHHSCWFCLSSCWRNVGVGAPAVPDNNIIITNIVNNRYFDFLSRFNQFDLLPKP